MVNDMAGIGKITESIEKGTKELRQLCYDFLAPSVKEAGLSIADKIKFYRFSNAVQAMQKASEIIKSAGIIQEPVGLKIFMPLMECCSLEEDQGMVSKWAGLLASAATGGMVLPSFVRILSDLSPDEAKMIEYIKTNGKEFVAVYNKGVEKEELLKCDGASRTRIRGSFVKSA